MSAAGAAGAPLTGDGRVLVCYGAGVIGRSMLRMLRGIGVEPAAFADDTPEKQGLLIDGLPIVTPREAAGRFGEQLTFVVTILNPGLRFLDARRRLAAVAPRARILSFLHLAHAWPDACLPMLQFDRPERLAAAAPAIRRAFALWSDEESRRQFVAHLTFRWRLDIEALPANGGEGYFPGGVVPPLPAGTVFVDGGAYDGDSIRSFLARQEGRFGRVHAFEPDAANCARLRAFVAALAPSAAARVHVHEAAVGSRSGRQRFSASGDMSAAASSSGTAEVEVVRIQDVVTPHEPPVFLKLDVEGAEGDALEGAADLIRAARPVLAISVYHRPADLWALPLYLDSLVPGYRCYLRTEGEDGMDAICFAVPPAGERR